MKWWFVLHGKEDTLKALEKNWENISLQTGWHLEQCTKPAKHANNTVTMLHQIPDDSNNDNTGSEVNSVENTIVSQISAQSLTHTMSGCIQESKTTESDPHESSITHSDPFLGCRGH